MPDPTAVSSGRRDYDGKSWLAKNAHHLGVLAIFALCFALYVMLPLLGKTVPIVDPEAWLAMGLAIGIRQYTSGHADIEVNKKP